MLPVLAVCVRDMFCEFIDNLTVESMFRHFDMLTFAVCDSVGD